MWFIIITYTVAVLTYVLFPSMQLLRPVEFERNNIFTQIVTFLYGFDTHTNVCPSLHVVGSMAVMFAGFDCNRIKKSVKVNAYFVITAILISVSTVFLKQHSVIDIFWGLVLSIAGYIAVYKTKYFRYEEMTVKEDVKKKEMVTV